MMLTIMVSMGGTVTRINVAPTIEQSETALYLSLTFATNSFIVFLRVVVEVVVVNQLDGNSR